ncbi:unnamed protein product [marine sediment metagenome]|uniref:N-acetyltransferase domain-containing protein n=1 Tax=marine sediment metagenome TaxID=412755 RepID=X1CG24_9ZZZZ
MTGWIPATPSKWLSSTHPKNLTPASIPSFNSLAKTKGALEVILNSQQSAAGFYEKLGFRQEGELFEEVGIPHVVMTRKL